MGESKELVHPSCRFCRPMSYYGGQGSPRGEMRRYFCFGERHNSSPVDQDDKYNFCVYTPFKGVIQFHMCYADINAWIAIFVSVWRQLTGRPIDFATISSMADAFTLEVRK